MLKLGKQAGPQRITLRPAQGVEGEDGYEPEAFIVMAPITPAMRRRALRATRRMLADRGVSDPTQVDDDLLGDMGEAVSCELIRLGALEWGGIGGDDDDQPLDLTPDRDLRFQTANVPDRPTGTIDLLLADQDIFDLIDEKYVRPDARRRAEKNALSGSPAGTGTEATPGSGTANSAAKRTRRAGAKSARTSNTSRKRKTAKASGRS